jgi:ferritin-like metal-binding protein YciE
MKLTTLEHLFHHELKDLYDAEHQIIKALPKLAERATNPELAQAFEEHLAQTKGHIERLESVFREIGARPERQPCAGMKGHLEDGSKMLAEDAAPEVMDAALISAAQRVEHYEMAGYGTLRTWARILGHEESARLLEETLDEEEGTDSALTGIAQGINAEAAGGRSEREHLGEDGAEESSSETSPVRGTQATKAKTAPRRRSKTGSRR